MLHSDSPICFVWGFLPYVLYGSYPLVLVQTVTLWGQDPNFGLLQLLYSCTAGLLPILSTDLETAQNFQFWV